MGLVPEFSETGDLRISFDLSEIDDLQEPEKERRSWANQGYLNGILTQNEARDVVGQPPVPGGNHFKTRTSDGKAQVPEKLPDANPADPTVSAAGSSEEDRAHGALETSISSLSPDPSLRVVGE